MPGKALCISGMVIAGLVMIFFLLDFVFGLVGLTVAAPFKFSSPLMDVAFILLAAGLGFLSWSAWKEIV
jgi:hypothetical protein